MIVLAAHCDDAALSLGAAISSGRLGKVRTAVFFSISKYTRHAPGTGDEKAVTALRRREECAAAKLCGYEPLFLGLPEPFVRPGYALDDLRDVSRDPRADPVFPAARAAAQRLGAAGDPLLFPLAAGGHIDHRILASIGKEFCRRGLVAGFYEDIPYATRWGRAKTAAFARAEYGGLLTRRLALARKGRVSPKRRALLCFHSQLSAAQVSDLMRRTRGVRGEAIWLTPVGEGMFSEGASPQGSRR